MGAILMNKIWKELKKKPGYYISNHGEVLGKQGHVLKTFVNNSGYECIKIQKDHYLIHRLVADAFVPNPQELSEVDHINNDSLDNRASNLQWLSSVDNHNKMKTHVMQETNKDIAYKARQALAKSSLKPVYQRDLWGNILERFDSVKAVSKKYPTFESSAICNVCNGVLATYKGYIWSYEDPKDVVATKNKQSLPTLQKAVKMAQLHKSPVYKFDTKGNLLSKYETYDSLLHSGEVNKDSFRKIIQVGLINYKGFRWVLIHKSTNN